MRHIFVNIFLLAGLIFCHTGLLSAQQQACTPNVGSAERKMLLDTLRASVKQEIKTEVVFKVDHMKVQDGWAFIRGVPQQPSGEPLSYENTRYATAIKEGFFDDWICALLQKQHGKWKVVTYEIGATDVPYLGWEQQYHAPSGIFK